MEKIDEGENITLNGAKEKGLKIFNEIQMMTILYTTKDIKMHMAIRKANLKHPKLYQALYMRRTFNRTSK